jgi:hypothetical protein
MSKFTAFRCPSDLLRRAKLAAESERRSLSNYIIYVLEEDLLRRAVEHYDPAKRQQYLHRPTDAS